MIRNVSVTVSDDLAKWVNGLSDFEIGDPALEQWQQVADVFFERTQRFVHIISGDLKTSGKEEVSVDRKTVNADTTYGGVFGTRGPVDYAVYELANGGAHDFFTRALTSTASEFQDGLYQGILAQMAHNLKVA